MTEKIELGESHCWICGERLEDDTGARRCPVEHCMGHDPEVQASFLLKKDGENDLALGGAQ